MRSFTSPRGVNFTALDSRLRSTCCRRCSSARSSCGTSESTSTLNDRPLSWASGANAASSRSTIFGSDTWIGWMSIRPASTFDRSSMSLISWSSAEPALWMVLANSTCCEVRLPSAFSVSSLASTSRLLSGVRSSWDMLARNSDL